MRYIYTITNNAIMIVDSQNGETHAIPANEELRFNNAFSAIKSEQFDELTKVLYPEQFFIFPDLELKDNYLYLRGEQLPNKFALKLIKHQSQFKALYNFWLNSSTRNMEENKQHIIDLIESNGYPLTDDGFYFAYSGKAIPCNMFFNTYNISGELGELFKQEKSLDEILTISFGTVTKKLRNEVIRVFFKKEQNNTSHIEPTFYYLGKLLQGIFSLENIINLLDSFSNSGKIFSNISPERFNQVSDFVHEMFKGREKRLMNLICKQNSLNSLIQCVTVYHQLIKKIEVNLNNIDYSSFDELHKFLLNETFKLNTPLIEINMPLNFPSLVENPKALSVEGFDVVYPKSNYDLHQWSFNMSNCIRGYTDRANTPEYLLLALIQDNKMIVNLEVRNINGKWELIQFKKYGNQSCENTDLAKKVFNHIKKEIIFWVPPKFYPVKRNLKKHKHITI